MKRESKLGGHSGSKASGTEEITGKYLKFKILKPYYMRNEQKLAIKFRKTTDKGITGCKCQLLCKVASTYTNLHLKYIWEIIYNKISF